MSEEVIEAPAMWRYSLSFDSPVAIDEDDIRDQIEGYLAEDVIPYDLRRAGWGIAMNDVSCEIQTRNGEWVEEDDR